MDRRSFLGGIMAGGAAAALPRYASAEIAIGSGTLTTVSDGSLMLPRGFLLGSLSEADAAPVLESYGISGDQLTPPCNLAVYRDGDATVLFDVGSGPDFMPSAGKITDSLDAIGLAPEDITHVVFTHCHPDHIWGLLDDFDEPLFYEASYLMGRREWDYWWDPETVNSIGEARAVFAVGAKRRMEAIEDQVTLFDGGDEIMPGISAVATHGHTPGHMSFELRQGGTSALVLGDAIVNHHLAFARPDWPNGADHDAEMGIKTRKMLFDRVTAEQIQVVGFHLPGGGIGRVDRDGDGYRFVQEG